MQSKRSSPASAALTLLVVTALVLTSCGDTTTRSAGSADQSVVAASSAADCAKPGAKCLDQDFRGMDLSGKDFSGAILSGSKFDGANLRGSKFDGAVLQGTSFAPTDCGVPMTGQCLKDYEWNTLAPPVPVSVSATLDSFAKPTAFAVTRDSKTAFVADAGKRQVFKMDLTTGAVSAFAGTGNACPGNPTPSSCGDGLSGSLIRLTTPAGLALDEEAGLLYVSDADANLIWQVELAEGQTASVLAGTGRPGTPKQGEGHEPLNVPLSGPRGLAWDANGNRLVFADSANNAVRAVSLGDSTVPLIAGQANGVGCDWLATSSCGTIGFATDAILNTPMAVSVATDGAVYIADTNNAAIRKVDSTGNISSVIAPASDTPKAEAGSFPKPKFVALDRDGNLLVGPTASDGQGIGWLAQGAAAKSQDWSKVTTIVRTPVSAGAVAPNLRFVLAADRVDSKVRVVVPRVGPNVKDASFVSANLSADFTSGVSTVFDGIFQNGAKFDGSKMAAAIVKNSYFMDLADIDLRGATLGAVPALTGRNICLSEATLTAETYPNWKLTDSSLGVLRATDKPTVFTDPVMDNVTFANSENSGRWVFQKGILTKVNFSPAEGGKDNGQFVFNGTSLSNTPRNQTATELQNHPNYSSKPTDWDDAAVAKACQSDKVPVPGVGKTLAVAIAPDYSWKNGRWDESGTWSTFTELSVDAHSRLTGGQILQTVKGSSAFTEIEKSFDYILTLDRTGAVIAKGTLASWTGSSAVPKATDLGNQIDKRQSVLGVIRAGDTFSGEIIDKGDAHNGSRDEVKSSFSGTFTAVGDKAVALIYLGNPAVMVRVAPNYVRPQIPDNSGACKTAHQKSNNKHNICTTFVNYAPQFTAPNTLATTNIFSGATVDANGTSAHHVNATPSDMGASSFGATSAATGYTATMNWTYNAKWPTNTFLAGNMQKGSNDSSSSANCVAGSTYLNCYVISKDFSQPFVNSDQAMSVTYALVNAPLTLSINNTTGKDLTYTPLSQKTVAVLDDPAAQSGNAKAIPSSQQAFWGGYREIRFGPSVSYQLEYTYLVGAASHVVSINVSMKPTNTGAALQQWAVDTSGSSCSDKPVGTAATPCQINFDQTSSWVNPVTASVTIGS